MPPDTASAWGTEKQLLRCSDARSWGGEYPLGDAVTWPRGLASRFCHMSPLPGLIAPTGPLQKSVGQSSASAHLKWRNMQAFVTGATESALNMLPVFQNLLWAFCCPSVLVSRVTVPLNPPVLPNLCWLNPDYQHHLRTLGNKITALLPSWATLFQINHSKLIWFPLKCTHQVTSNMAHRCTCAQQWHGVGCCFGWRTESAPSSLIPFYAPTHPARLLFQSSQHQLWPTVKKEKKQTQKTPGM